MKKNFASLLSLVFFLPPLVFADSTIIFFRHGEKPANDSGQLTCKGMNRALKLPDVLLKHYGKPSILYASSPKKNKMGSSLRPLETIIPTAIRISQKINLRYSAEQTDELVGELIKSQHKNSITFISWEHKNLVLAARKLLKQTGGEPDLIPKWRSDDFDSMYIIKLDSQMHFKSFIHAKEGLNSAPLYCNIGS